MRRRLIAEALGPLTMRRDFEIRQGIYLVQPPHMLDLHNDFEFRDLRYSVETRTLLLFWRRSRGKWVPSGAPESVTVEFQDVSEFRFLPRNPKVPFTEDDCVSQLGYWTDEDWADGVFEAEKNVDPNWLAAIEFQSGAVLAVQAASACARVEA